MNLISLIVRSAQGLALAGLLFFLAGCGDDSPSLENGVLTVSGRIEGDEAQVAAKMSGRIEEIRVREGDRVEAGQVIAVLDDAQIRSREDQAAAAADQAEARVRLARQQIPVLQQQMRQVELQVEQARMQAGGQVRQAEANLASAEAALAEGKASLALAQYDKEAYSRLAKSGAVSQRQGRQAETTAEAQTAMVRSLERRKEAAEAAVTAAKASLQQPDILRAQADAIQQQILQAQAEVAAAQAEAARARARLEETRADRADLEIRAPFSGTVATRAAEPGEVATPGMPIVTLLDLDTVYLRGFVPEGRIGLVRVGQPARVFLDSAPGKPLAAAVRRIDPEAAFTPENTYFREDRVKQVVGVKLQLREGSGFAKPGMPADGQILVEGSAWPEAEKE